MTELVRFGRFKNVLDVPALTELHVKAYIKFLQRDLAVDKREDYGLESILRETFPIKNYDGTISLEYVHYEIGQPRYTPEECRMLRLSYGAPLKVRLRLNKPEIFINVDLPARSPDRRRLHRERRRARARQPAPPLPGIDYNGEERVGDKKMHSCWIVPERGSWIEISVTKRDSVAIRIDQGGKIPATTFLRACSPEFSTNEDIIRVFHETAEVKIAGADEEQLIGRVVVKDVVDSTKNEKILAGGQRIAKGMLKLMEEAGLKTVEIIPKSATEDNLILNTLEGRHPFARGGAAQDLRPPAPGHAPDAGQGQAALLRALLRSAALPAGPGRAFPPEPQVPDEHPRVGDDGPEGRRRQLGQVHHEDAPERGNAGRHRPPGQPPGPHDR